MPFKFNPLVNSKFDFFKSDAQGALSASDFGVVAGTGEDMTSNLSTALNTAIAQGKILQLPPGTINIYQEILIAPSSSASWETYNGTVNYTRPIGICGYGTGITKIIQHKASCRHFYYLPADSLQQELYFEGFTLENSNYSISDEWQAGIQIGGGKTNSVCTNITIKSVEGVGLYATFRTDDNTGMFVGGIIANQQSRYYLESGYNADLITFQDFLGYYDNPVDVSCSNTSGTDTLSSISSGTTPYLHIGMSVSGSGIPANTTITSVSSTSITISNNTTSAVSSFSSHMGTLLSLLDCDGTDYSGSGFATVANARHFTVSGVTTAPAVGDTYTNNSQTFTILNVNINGSSGTISCSETGAPSSSGTLTRSTGSGDATITFSDAYNYHNKTRAANPNVISMDNVLWNRSQGLMEIYTASYNIRLTQCYIERPHKIFYDYNASSGGSKSMYIDGIFISQATSLYQAPFRILAQVPTGVIRNVGADAGINYTYAVELPYMVGNTAWGEMRFENITIGNISTGAGFALDGIGPVIYGTPAPGGATYTHNASSGNLNWDAPGVDRIILNMDNGSGSGNAIGILNNGSVNPETYKTIQFVIIQGSGNNHVNFDTKFKRPDGTSWGAGIGNGAAAGAVDTLTFFWNGTNFVSREWVVFDSYPTFNKLKVTSSTNYLKFIADNYKIWSKTISSFSTTAGAYSNILTFDPSSGNYNGNFDIQMTLGGSGISQAKTYHVPYSYNGTSGGWQTLLPISSSGPYSGEDISLQININLAVMTLRILRISGSNAADVNVVVKYTVTNSAVDVADDTSSGTGGSAGNNYAATAASMVSGRLGINTDSPSDYLDINGNLMRLRTAKTPSSASDTGTTGQICWDSNYVYVCVGTNTWKRAAISTW